MKRILTLFFTILILSCNNYTRSQYPQSVIATGTYANVMRNHQLEVDSLTAFPKYIQDKITQHLKTKLGAEKYSQLNWESFDIFSDKPIPIREPRSMTNALLYGNDSITQSTGNEIDSIYNYPLYSSFFILELPELGIKELRLQLVLDEKAEIIKDIAYSRKGFDNFIPIDSVHSELIWRKIPYKKLNIHLWFNRKTESFIWETNTLIRQGSIFGPSCFPEVDYHFKMNAISGEIVEYDFEKREEYFADIY